MDMENEIICGNLRKIGYSLIVLWHSLAKFRTHLRLSLPYTGLNKEIFQLKSLIKSLALTSCFLKHLNRQSEPLAQLDLNLMLGH